MIEHLLLLLLLLLTEHLALLLASHLVAIGIVADLRGDVSAECSRLTLRAELRQTQVVVLKVFVLVSVH